MGVCIVVRWQYFFRIDQLRGCHAVVNAHGNTSPIGNCYVDILGVDFHVAEQRGVTGSRFWFPGSSRENRLARPRKNHPEAGYYEEQESFSQSRMVIRFAPRYSCPQLTQHSGSW